MRNEMRSILFAGAENVKKSIYFNSEKDAEDEFNSITTELETYYTHKKQ
jgi:hypothetical protein